VAVGTIKSRCARGRARLLPYLGHLRPSTAAAGAPEGEARQSPPRSATGSIRRGFAGSGPFVTPSGAPPGLRRSRLNATAGTDGRQDPKLADPVIGRNPAATAPVKPAGASKSVVTPKVAGASGPVPIEGGDHDHAP
jgi:RNA polymerase sigma-70 factor (ECF subfamily)